MHRLWRPLLRKAFMTSFRPNALPSAIACEPLERPAHGSMDCFPSSRALPYNATCHFRCAEGFELHGEDTVRCAYAGQWAAPAPLCQGKETSQHPSVSFSLLKASASAFSICTVIHLFIRQSQRTY